MNIAILGGSFDPPHRGHAIIAKRLLKLNKFDEVWLIPLFSHPFNKSLSSPQKRLEMTKLLENGKIRVSDFEIKKRRTSYTIATLKTLGKNSPRDRFSLIIGTDQVKDFTKWKNWKEIINNFKLIIVPRAGFKKAEKELKDIAKQIDFPKNIILINKKEFPPIYISSTFARQKIRQRKSAITMLPKKIEEYIIRNKLYR